MTTESEPEFSMMIDAPHAYQAHKKGFGRALAHGASVERAARDCRLSPDELAGALGVLKKAKRGIRGAGHIASKAGRLAVRTNPLAVTALTAKYAGRGLAAVTGPIRRKIFRAFFGKLIARRARFLSWRTRSLRPNQEEAASARVWAVRYVKHQGILGKLVGASLSGDSIGDPATAALVTASIPVLIELARRALRMAESHGAPADPRAADPQPEESQPQE